MPSDELAAIAVEPELLEELQRVLYAGESIEAFMTQAIRDAVDLRLMQSQSGGQDRQDGDPEGGS